MNYLVVKGVSKLDAESCAYVRMAMLCISKIEVVHSHSDVVPSSKICACLLVMFVPRKSFKSSLCNPEVRFGRAPLITW